MVLFVHFDTLTVQGIMTILKVSKRCKSVRIFNPILEANHKKNTRKYCCFLFFKFSNEIILLYPSLWVTVNHVTD